MKRIVPVLAALALTSCGESEVFIASNSLIVRDVGGGNFEVPFRGESGDFEFWCAAGEYVIRKLSLSPTTRVYRLSPPPRRSGQGITFSLSPEGAQNPGVFTSSSDGGLTASFARSLCRKRVIPDLD